jgi:outer membrane protein OmpA-like peptidoglycan-associated protein
MLWNNIQKKTIATSLLAALALGGCANLSETQKGTAQGAAIGVGAGAVLGALVGGGKGAAIGAAVGAGVGSLAGNTWSKKMQAQKQEMEAATAGTGVAVTQTADNRLKLDIPSDISFEIGRADINPNFRAVLDSFAASLASNPTTSITIVGHTDSSGSDAINQPLSLNRAAAVRDYLSNRSVASSRINVEGRGSREPLVTNNTSANKAKNRRVEIFVAEPAAQN